MLMLDVEQHFNASSVSLQPWEKDPASVAEGEAKAL